MSNELAISQIVSKVNEMVKTMSPYERADLAGQVKNALNVPGILWSPEDYEDTAEETLKTIPTASGDPHVPSKEDIQLLAVQAFEEHANSGYDLTDDEWDIVSQNVDFAFTQKNFKQKKADELTEGDMIFFTDYERCVYNKLSYVESVDVDPSEGIAYVYLTNGQETYATDHPVRFMSSK